MAKSDYKELSPDELVGLIADQADEVAEDRPTRRSLETQLAQAEIAKTLGQPGADERYRDAKAQLRAHDEGVAATKERLAALREQWTAK